MASGFILVSSFNWVEMIPQTSLPILPPFKTYGFNIDFTPPHTRMTTNIWLVKLLFYFWFDNAKSNTGGVLIIEWIFKPSVLQRFISYRCNLLT